MTRVLVVNHDHDVADIEADALRRAGYDVDQCAGPTVGARCPVLSGERCWQVDLADVLVYDMWSRNGAPELIDDLAALHPDKPVVLTSGGAFALDWVDAEPNRAGTLVGGPPRASLVTAVERALRAPRPPRDLSTPNGRPRMARW